MQKCCMKDCKEEGKPQEGFDFFVCEKCLAELERLLDAEGRRRVALHENN